jgi:hypothetical protein
VRLRQSAILDVNIARNFQIYAKTKAGRLLREKFNLDLFSSRHPRKIHKSELSHMINGMYNMLEGLGRTPNLDLIKEMQNIFTYITRSPACILHTLLQSGNCVVTKSSTVHDSGNSIFSFAGILLLGRRKRIH